MPHLSCISLPAMRPAELPASLLLCLGNFDGVHLAHRRLLLAARSWRDRAFPGIPVGVFCFRELSSDFLLAEPPGHLCTSEERLERFAECGMEYAVLANFPEIRSISPEDYVKTVLMEQCHCVAAACGFNHRFGRGGKGTPELLRRMLGGRLLLQAPVLDGGKPISSTRIRALLADGRPEEAARLLAHPYTLCAPVLHGKALGRTIGVPTINQKFPEHAMLPRFGVYATACVAEGKRLYGVSNVGIHPTVDRDAPANCETYLLDFCGDLYGKAVQVSFLRFLRPERRFDSVDALKAQIERDAASVRELFASMPPCCGASAHAVSANVLGRGKNSGAEVFHDNLTPFFPENPLPPLADAASKAPLDTANGSTGDATNGGTLDIANGSTRNEVDRDTLDTTNGSTRNAVNEGIAGIESNFVNGKLRNAVNRSADESCSDANAASPVGHRREEVQPE